MEITRLTGSIGSKISGVQLADIDDAIFSDIANKLWTHQVLVFRDQQMNIKDQIGCLLVL
ncbi:MAG TPA: hypothetical protein EYO73_11370 [Sulfurimonas sp.]|nr:hypothetical protein [Sulfurimonas sp.]